MFTPSFNFCERERQFQSITTAGLAAVEGQVKGSWRLRRLRAERDIEAIQSAGARNEKGAVQSTGGSGVITDESSSVTAVNTILS